MKVTGLIAEYNPFHNGHLYHLEQSRRETEADYCVCLMSGSYVQRGAPAIYDKYERTLMALRAGADLILEMPVAFSTASAREFASFGIALFSDLGADSVCFGSECGSMEPLLRIAGQLSVETAEYTAKLKEGLKKGMTYPESRSHALSASLTEEDRAVLKTPNNILGVEYCLAAHQLKSPLSLYTIQRTGKDYHDTSIEDTADEARLSAEGSDPGSAGGSGHGSATAIRLALSSGKKLTAVRTLVPPFVYETLRTQTPLFADDFSSLLNYRILTETNLNAIADMTPDLAARIRSAALVPDTFEHRIQSLKSRQFTYTRVSRALLHLVLNMRQDELRRYRNAGYAPYARILGFRHSAAPLLTHLKQRSSIPLVTKLADASRLLSPTALSMLEQEILASHLYQTVKQEKGCAFKNEYTQPIAIL